MERYYRALQQKRSGYRECLGGPNRKVRANHCGKVKKMEDIRMNLYLYEAKIQI